MARLEVLSHSTVYRNEQPSRSSEYVAFPSVQALPDDTLLCMCRHGSARESDDGTVKIHRSKDGGATWAAAGALPEPAEIQQGWRLPGGFGVNADGTVLAWARYPTGQHVWRSADSGLTWSEPITVETGPLGTIGVGGNLVTLPDGSIVSASECGDQEADPPDWSALISRSTDGGHTWDTWRKVQGPRDGHYFFDLRITGLADGRLLAAYWTQDVETDSGLNVHTAWSSDGGNTWTEPRDTGFWGQVTDVAGLQSGRVIAVSNHRRSPMGVRAVLSEDGGAHFSEADHVELWGIEAAVVRGAPVLSKKRDLVEDVFESYHFFTWGTPSATQLSDGTIITAFYVTEEHVTYVRCCCLRETG